MAMIAPMNTVPQNKGIEPNAPDEPAWSARIAVCGLHCVPNRKSAGGTMLKKRRLSNISESRIPSVVRMAISEAAISIPIIQRSTAVRARNAVAVRRTASQPPTSAKAIASSPPRVAKRASAAANCGASVLDSGLKPASRSPRAISRASARIDCRCTGSAGNAWPSAGRQDRRVDQPGLQRRPGGEQDQRRDGRPQRRMQAVIDGQRVKPAVGAKRAAPAGTPARTRPRRRRMTAASAKVRVIALAAFG